MPTLIGPFSQILTMDKLPLMGALKDNQLEIIENGGILIKNDIILQVGKFDNLKKDAKQIEIIKDEQVLLPGFIDTHTHICFAGSRAKDYALRNEGISYLEIAKQGGGIWDTVTKTRAASQEELEKGLSLRASKMLSEGVTTCEVKSGYGLSVEQELKILKAIKNINNKHKIDLIATCLAAHIKPKDFDGNNKQYLDYILKELLPKVKQEELANRIDIFIEENAFAPKESLSYLLEAKKMGFDITIHADQFTPYGTKVACDIGAISADHLEASTEKELKLLADNDIIGTALPGASFGLGCELAPGRKLLDLGGILVIATDWNPGSAPMGDLLLQVAIYGAYEKLSVAETFSAITSRAALAIKSENIGILKKDYLADFISFPCNDFREILYHQGKLKPQIIWKSGKLVN